MLYSDLVLKHAHALDDPNIPLETKRFIHDMFIMLETTRNISIVLQDNKYLSEVGEQLHKQVFTEK